jgi:hypothetical protein
MRKFFGTLAVLALASAASAQTVNSGAINCKGYDDGTYENCWKVQNPSGPSDYFNVDFNADCAGALVVAICVEVCETSAGGSHGSMGIYNDNLGLDPTGGTPDLSSPVCPPAVGPTGLPGTFCTDMVAYDIPDCTLGGSNVHAVYCFAPGDSSVWVCGDVSGSANRSFFTLDGYSTPALPFTVNWAIRLGAIPAAGGVLWINGGTSTNIQQNGGTVCFLFTGPCGNGTPFMIWLSNCGGGIIVPALPFILFTGFGAVDDAGNTASICGAYTCALPAPLAVCFVALYLDPCDPKPNGKGKIKVSNDVTLGVSPSKVCSTADPCYGQRDDGAVDATIWKVQNPAGSGDYFNVHYGVAGAGQVTNLTGIEIASWDFCGTGPSWGAVMSSDSDTAFDPSGGTPNIATPVASATQLSMGPAQSDWAYPATFYDYPDAAYGGENLHGVACWPSGDSCIWLGSDTDFVDGTCDLLGASYFTADGYATIAVQFFGANWLIKQYWN